MPRITIDDQSLDVRDGLTVLEAASEVGITIPTLCYHKDLSVDGSCRLCMVEVDARPGQVSACTCPVSDGMVVHTETPTLAESRRSVLEMLLRNYVAPYPEEGENELLRWVRHYGVKRQTEAHRRTRYPVDSDPNPFIRIDLNQCILCTRCVRACEEVQGRCVWGVGYRGSEARIIAGLDTTLLEARCESCGACEAYCPTGALSDRLSYGRGRPEKKVTTTCGYCGVGCQFDLNVKDGHIIGVTSNPSAPVNGMSLCVKGRYGWDFVHHQDRLRKPRVRRYLLDGRQRPCGSGDRGDWVEVDWDHALHLVACKLVAVKQEHGPDAIGVLSSAKCTNEENYLMQKFARQVIGTHNVDHCARLCHASTVAGLAMAFGSGAMSNSMRDIVDHAAAMLIIGSNTTEQHPVFGAMIRQAVRRRGVKLVVADPRRIDITEFAALHIRQRPGTDVALLNGLMYIILKNDWQDQPFINDRCEGFDDFRLTVAAYPPQRVAEITGVSATDLNRAAEILATHHPMSVIWAMGITQHTTGVMNVLSLANLQMLLGNMGLPGGGVNPLRGQNNVQGACDMGALPDVFPGYQPVTDAGTVAKLAKAWACIRADGGTDQSQQVAHKPGLTLTEMVEEAGRTEVRALYILGEDPVLTEPDSTHVRASLAASEFVVLQEIFPSETSHYADVLLPGATFVEKSGTFTNTERRVQLIRPAIEPLSEARPDWAITADLARRMLALEAREPTGPHAFWSYETAADVMHEIAALTPSYAGVSHERLERGHQLQWPVLNANHPGTPILHADRFTRGKGMFHAIDYLPATELPDEPYPLLLTTGRVLYHWHGGELTRRARGLLEAFPETLLEINPNDAARIGVSADSQVRVISRRGEMIARAMLTERVSTGVVFGNFHFPGSQNVNNVTIAALDPIAKIPAYKVCAVRVEPA